LAERLDQPFIIENRPGAATNLATETVVRALPDGYTLLFVGQPAAINATLYERLNFNFIRDIAPVSGMVRVPNLMLLHPSIPTRTVPEFITYAKSRPGQVNFGSGGLGTTSHMAGELFKMMMRTQELTFNPSFYPSLVRMPMARYRRNIWKSGGSRLSVCPWRDIGEIYGNPVAPSEVELMPGSRLSVCP
jgi:hypothetical protein